MRDIEFRGKRIDNGEWVYGYVAEISTYGVTGHRIAVGIYEKPEKEFDGDWWEVDPETVGQYTGLKDKNGTKIFEGDRVKWFSLGKMCIYKIIYDTGIASFVGQTGIIFTIFDYDSSEFEVIGNIHDNKLEDNNNG